jgi:hypothetical protein
MDRSYHPVLIDVAKEMGQMDKGCSGLELEAQSLPFEILSLPIMVLSPLKYCCRLSANPAAKYVEYSTIGSGCA